MFVIKLKTQTFQLFVVGTKKKKDQARGKRFDMKENC